MFSTCLFYSTFFFFLSVESNAMLDCNMFQVTCCTVLCIAVFRKPIYTDALGNVLGWVLSCWVYGEKKRKKINPPHLLLAICREWLKPWSLLSLDWASVTMSLGQVWAHVCIVMYFCWISQGAWCGISAGWYHGCPTCQTELFPTSISLGSCVIGRLYTSTGPWL